MPILHEITYQYCLSSCAAEVTGIACHSRQIKENEKLEAEEKARREAENAEEEATTEEWTVASFFGF